MNRSDFCRLHDTFARVLVENAGSTDVIEKLMDYAFDLFEANIAPQTEHLPPLACEKGCPSCSTLRSWGLPENDEMIQALAADRPDKPFGKAILPR